MSNRACVLSGGGVKGAFQVGVLHRLLNHDQQRFDAYCGVSTGALTAAMLAQGSTFEEQLDQLGTLMGVYNMLTNDSIYDGNRNAIQQAIRFITRDAIFQPTGLWRLIEQHIDPERLHKSGADFMCGVVDVEEGNYHTIFNDTHNVLKFILASASMPGYFPAVQINNRHFIDGGLRNQTPFKDAVEFLKMSGHQAEMVIILASPLTAKRYDGPMQGPKLLARTMEIVLNESFVNDLETLLDRNNDLYYRHIPVRLYQPPEHYGSALDFNPASIRRMMTDGYNAEPTVLTTTGDLMEVLDEA